MFWYVDASRTAQHNDNALHNDNGQRDDNALHNDNALRDGNSRTAQRADGLTPDTAFATLGEALAAAGPDDTVLLHRGSTYRVDTLTHTAPAIAAYGEGAAPLIDARQALPAHTFYEVQPGVFAADITFREAPVYNQGAHNPQSTHHQVWDGMDRLHFQFEGESIADTVAAVAATPGSFALHYRGSEVADPRQDKTHGADFTLYVNLGAGRDPAQADLSIADQERVIFGGADLSDVALVGGYSKDNFGAINADSDPSNFTTLHNVTILDAAAHGLVGPLHATGTLTVSGRGEAGSALHEKGFNTFGSLINVFTPVEYRTGSEHPTTLTFQTVDVSVGYWGIFGHGIGTSGGYQGLTVETLRADAVNFVIDYALSAGRPFIEHTRVDTVEARNINTLAGFAGELEVTGGSVDFAPKSMMVDRSQQLIIFRGENDVARLTSLEMTFTDKGSAGHYLAVGRSPAIETATLVLHDVVDRSAPEDRATLAPGDAPHLVLSGQTVLGDLQPFDGAMAALPASLTVHEGVTFGFGGRTGAEIEAFLAERGIPFAISSHTTIVDETGAVIDGPGWERYRHTEDDHAMTGTEDADLMTGNGGEDTLWGRAGDDTLEGAWAADLVRGGGGDDLMDGGADNDVLLAGDGHDTLIGGSGDDLMRGHTGNDTMSGGDGDDLLRGNQGDDALYGGAGADQLRGHAGTDTLHAGEGDDHMRGNGGADLIHAGAGADTASGGVGEDTVHGEDGADVLWGFLDDDQLFGGAGADTLHGRHGSDTLWGGEGADTFVFSHRRDSDIIADFEPGIDRIDVADLAGAWSFATIMESAARTDMGLHLSLARNAEVVLEGVTVAALSADDFIFA